ncbi:hypothetical protein [Methanogenium organophilum]|uniref:Uncharacterized protein n=1 Tax=Methanogenium organophilum TaxID=2199 RepID=A0A9X9S242_METOG|nr:hypothetical protein [Methanogenium organophilum]WAI00404.1 hypothetical protein OU421_08165 [Methanogenium organophilum]
MPELFFWGLSIDTIANLCVGIGTAILAIATFLLARYTKSSVTSSKEQLEILRNQFNLDQKNSDQKHALERLKQIIMPLNEEIGHEIGLVKNGVYCFGGKEPKFNCLIFPIPKNKYFYAPETGLEHKALENELKNQMVLEISGDHPNLIELLQQRWGIYTSIASKIEILKNGLTTDSYKSELETLIRKDSNFEQITLDEEEGIYEELFVIYEYETYFHEGKKYHVPLASDYFSIENLIEAIVNLVICEFFNVSEPSKKHFFDDGLVEETLNIRSKFMEILEKDQFEETILKVNQSFSELKDVDSKICIILGKIILEYRQGYNLTSDEILFI